MADTVHRVTVRYFAAARAASGVPEEQVSVPSGSTLADLLRVVVDRHGAGLERVLGRCSYLLDEVAVPGHDTPLPDGCAVDVLPPFAGG